MAECISRLPIPLDKGHRLATSVQTYAVPQLNCAIDACDGCIDYAAQLCVKPSESTSAIVTTACFSGNFSVPLIVPDMRTDPSSEDMLAI